MYRYGFNGQEKSDEIKGSGNSYTAEFWEYDPRLGRRWNVDPKPKPYLSDYSAFANNPISLIDPHGDDTLRVFGGKNNSQIDVIYGKGTATHTFDLKDIKYLPNTDIGKHTIDLTGLEDPDVIGLDLSGSATGSWLSGQLGVNLLWHTRGDNETWKPEIHLYSGVGGAAGTGGGDFGGAGSASVLFGYANTNKDGKRGKASPDFVANGYNWTGSFYTVASTLSLKAIDCTASRFYGYDPTKGVPTDGSSYWSGFSIGLGRSIPKPTSKGVSANVTKQHYYLLYGNGKDYNPNTNENLNGLNFPPVSQPPAP